MRSSLFAEFNNNKPDGATIVQSNIIETATVPAGFYDGYDMVIFGGAAFNTIHANHWAALQTAIQNKTSKAFIIQADNCCVAANQSGLMNLLNGVFGTNYALSANHPAGTESYTLNPNSSYASVFTTNSISGANYYPIRNVAPSDVLFYSASNPTLALAGMKQLPGTTERNRFVAWFVDGTITQGAPWYTTNQNKIADAFFDAYNATTTMNCDTDVDGVPNHFDLDSDGDGCTDAKEASVSGTLRNGSVQNGANGGVVTSTINTTGAIAGLANSYGANGFADALETSAESGIINYVSTYASYALSNSLNICSGIDSDGDGVTDLTDLDDDNDGVLDVVESNWCKPLIASTIIPVGKTYGVTAASFGNYLPAVTAGLDATTCMSPGEVTTLNYEFGKTVNNPIIAFYGVDFAKEEWFDLNDNPVKLRILDASTPTSVTNNILTLSTSPVAGANTASTSAMGRVQVIGNVTGLKVKHTWLLTARNCDNHGFSFLEPIECLGGPDPDVDNDGIPNRLDLDSDGDGCTDALESGVIGTFNSGAVKNLSLIHI
jgi:hypothetical protein